VFVRGARPGDVLQIDILEHSFPCDWGYTCILPLLGTIPDDFDAYEIMHPDIDRERGAMVLPWGTEIALDPFFGVIAVAPSPHWGRCPSPPPRVFGGNMDNRELRPGTTLNLPVLTRGRCSWRATGTASRAMARSASVRSRRRSPAASA
jgi:acetamidase/formamidase